MTNQQLSGFIQPIFKHLFPLKFAEYQALREIRSQERIAVEKMLSERRIERRKERIAIGKMHDDQMALHIARASGLAPLPTFTRKHPEKPAERIVVTKPPPKPLAKMSAVARYGHTCQLDGCGVVITRSNQKFCTKAHGNKWGYQQRSKK